MIPLASTWIQGYTYLQEIAMSYLQGIAMSQNFFGIIY